MKNNDSWLHGFAIFAALCALIAILLGAVVTSLERPIAANSAASINPAFEFWHSIAGGVVLTLVLGLALLLRTQFGWIALAAGLVDGALGITGQGFPRLSGILHALIGQIFFGAIAAIAVITSASWKRGPEPIEDSWRPSMRSLAVAVPLIILLQTTLGACYRYHALGVLWHILNAMIVLMLNLIVAVFLIRQFPEHPTLKPAAVALAVITSIQVLLGFTTFMMLILFPETSLAVTITSVLHVATGALTFSAGLALAILMRYNIREGTVTLRSVTAQ